MNDIERLRDLARKRRAAVTSKIGRIRRTTGVDLSHTESDPRRDAKSIQRYTRIQLSNYIAELNAFTARDNGYIAGARGTVLQKKSWAQYKRLERSFNQLGAKRIAEIGEIVLPGGMTIADRETMVPQRVRAQGTPMNRLYENISRNPRQIAGQKALDKLIKTLESKLSKNYVKTGIADARKQFKDMAKLIGAPELMKVASGLTDYQFDTLWNYTNFVASFSLKYEVVRMAMANEHVEPALHHVAEDYAGDARVLLGWAQQLPETSSEARKANRSAQSRTKKKGRA